MYSLFGVIYGGCYGGCYVGCDGGCGWVIYDLLIVNGIEIVMSTLPRNQY